MDTRTVSILEAIRVKLESRWALGEADTGVAKELAASLRQFHPSSVKQVRNGFSFDLKDEHDPQDAADYLQKKGWTLVSSRYVKYEPTGMTLIVMSKDSTTIWLSGPHGRANRLWVEVLVKA